MTYNDVIVSMRILDRKHVTLLSTVYSCEVIDTEKTLENKRSCDQTGNHSLLK